MTQTCIYIFKNRDWHDSTKIISFIIFLIFYDVLIWLRFNQLILRRKVSITIISPIHLEQYFILECFVSSDFVTSARWSSSKIWLQQDDTTKNILFYALTKEHILIYYVQITTKVVFFFSLYEYCTAHLWLLIILYFSFTAFSKFHVQLT